MTGPAHRVTVPDNGYFIEVAIDGIRYRIVTEYRQSDRRHHPESYRAQNRTALARIKAQAQARRDNPPAVCIRHGNEYDAAIDGCCWECDSERHEQARDYEEAVAVAQYKLDRDRRS